MNLDFLRKKIEMDKTTWLSIVGIFGLFILLITPAIFPNKEERALANITDTISEYEDVLKEKKLEKRDLTSSWTPIVSRDMDDKMDKGELYSKSGLVKDSTFSGDYRLVPNDKKFVETDLKGAFILSPTGQVFYTKNTSFPVSIAEEEQQQYTKTDPSGPGSPSQSPIVSGDVEVSKSTDFSWVVSPEGYNVAGRSEKGYYKYVGKSKAIQIPDKINGYEITSYYRMFYEYRGDLTKVVSTNKKVENMDGMFKDAKISNLDLTELDVSSVKSMEYMFNNSLNYTDKPGALDVTNWDTSKVENMKGMFSKFRGSEIRGIEEFNTVNVEDMSNMFSSVESVKTLDLRKWNVSNVLTMKEMFRNSRINPEIGGLNSSKVKNMVSMFERNKSASPISIKGLNTDSVEDMTRMFAESSFTSITLSDWSNKEVKNMSRMFYSSSATELILDKFETPNVRNMGYMFYFLRSSKLDLSSFDTKKTVNTEGMFAKSFIEEINLIKFNMNKVKNASKMFKDASAEEILLEGVKMKKLEDTSQMFMGSKITKIDLSGIDFNLITDKEDMFKNLKLKSGIAQSYTDAYDLNEFYGKEVFTYED